MGTIVVARLGAEGEGIEIHSRQMDGRWAFWKTRSSDFDAVNGDGGGTRQSEPAADLAEVLPAIWPLLSPVDVHPTFLDWFRTHYETARAALPDREREMQEQSRHRLWRWILAGNRMPWFSEE